MAEDGTLWNMLPVAGDPLEEEELTRLTAEARERLVAYLAHWRAHVPAPPNWVRERIDLGAG